MNELDKISESLGILYFDVVANKMIYMGNVLDIRILYIRIGF
jgi:hypothetical protein